MDARPQEEDDEEDEKEDEEKEKGEKKNYDCFLSERGPI